MRHSLILGLVLAIGVSGGLAAAAGKKDIPVTDAATTKLKALARGSHQSLRLKLDDFESEEASAGGMWWAGADANKMGTTLSPAPWAAAIGGAPGSPGHSGRIHGHLGANKAPWAWAALSLTLKDRNLSPYTTLVFWAKGDGGTYTVRLQKLGLIEAENYAAAFVAPKEWTRVSIPFDQFQQPDWATKKVDKVFGDVEKLAFYPTSYEGDYDLSLDDLFVQR